jgi:ubiquinone/menaquinone biosynthesis C-methylase UbiE
MSSTDGHRLGYRRVDDDPDVRFLLETMDETTRWGATQALRSWERNQLEIRPGERLLDVGCGSGDAALALAADLGSTGEVVGIDVSDAMLRAARERSIALTCPSRFSIGDAMHLDEADAGFDVVRSERTLQWLPDPATAIAEMARVLRPGGRIGLIDTDWSTFTIDVLDAEVAAIVSEAMRVERNRPSQVGSRLVQLVRAAGFGDIAETSATHVWTAWDPDVTPAPAGCFSMTSMADDLVETGQLDRSDADRFVATIHDAARRGCFTMGLTMYAVVAHAPPEISA